MANNKVIFAENSIHFKVGVYYLQRLIGKYFECFISIDLMNSGNYINWHCI